MRVLELHKKPGVCYAFSDDGIELPVIDVTHPAFAVPVGGSEIGALTDRFVVEARRNASIVRRMMTRLLLRTSKIGRALVATRGSFFGGLDTYLLKLGPDNLGSYASALDRRIVGAFPSLMTRMRVEDMARLLADALAPELARAPGTPLNLINIAGGPAADSLNALILLRRNHPDTLARRPVAIRVFDVDAAGPSFGSRALAALVAAGAPLDSLDVTFEFTRYGWHAPSVLGDRLAALRVAEGVCAVSSEGGLFEYGSDDDIVQNLRVLAAATRSDSVVVGSVTREGEPVRLALGTAPFAIRPRTLGRFRELASKGGWQIDRAIEAPFSYSVRLTQA